MAWWRCRRSIQPLLATKGLDVTGECRRAAGCVRRLKLAIATHFPVDPDAPHGGVEAVSVNLVRALAAFDDLEVHVVTLDRGRTVTSDNDWAGAVIHRLPRHPSGELRNATGPGRRQLQEYLQRLQPAVVHAHDCYGLMVKGLRLPRVFTIHGFIYSDALLSGQKWPWLRSKIWRLIETAGWADQPHLISISPYVRERLNGIATGVIHDIDNPISEDFFNIVRAERPGTVFSAAAICPGKNTLTLIDAVAQAVRSGVAVELRLAGAVTDAAYGERVQRSIRDHGLQQRVIVLGQIRTSEIRQELARAAVFALVSLGENSPVAIEEAMAAGIPVLTSNRCGMPYMVQSGETGYLVDPENAAEIACRLQTLLADAAVRGDMAQAARAVALRRFHPRGVAERTRQVYHEALGSLRPTGPDVGEFQ
jgi:glycosyltransferase involved in cell wall biosynthesis